MYQDDNGNSHIWNRYSDGGHITLGRSNNVGIGTSDPHATLHVVGNLLGAARDTSGNALRICTGKTAPGNTNWQSYGTEGLVLWVNISNCDFELTPFLVSALHGSTSHWGTTGGSNVYDVSPSSFAVYVRYSSGGALTPQNANDMNWHLHWIAIGK